MASKCSECGNTEYYNFALNIGMCNRCISKKLERIKELEIAKTIGIQACDLLRERVTELEADLKIKQSVCETIEKEVTAINKGLEATIKKLVKGQKAKIEAGSGGNVNEG